MSHPREFAAAIESLEDRVLLAGVECDCSQSDGGSGDGGLDDGHDVYQLAEDLYLPRGEYLSAIGGFLSDAVDGDPLEIAMGYLQDNADAFGLSVDDITSSIVSNLYTSATSGITHIYFDQMLNGLEILNADLNVNVTSDGQVLSVGSSFIGGLSSFSSLTQPAMDALGAVQALSSQFGWQFESQPSIISSGDDLGQTTLIGGSGISREDIPAELVYVPTAEGVELAWNLNVQTIDGAHWYDVSVSADDGDLVQMADWASHASYEVFSAPKESPYDGPRTVEVDPHLTAPNASPFGWHDTNGVAGAESTLTQGNNVRAYADRNDDNMPDAGSQPDGGAGLDFSSPLDLTMAPSTYQDAAVTNLFYWNNIIHDWHYQYGFDEVSGNFQSNNYGNGGAGNDAVNAEAQDGADVGKTNNANFATPPDGIAPRMQMFEFTLTNPRRDGDLDNGIILHEYGHGVSNRLTGGAANSSALNAVQSRGMGEGWSDIHALLFNLMAADQALDARGIGTYALGQAANGPGIRNFPYSYDMAINPQTFGDIAATNIPHGVGEIWAATLYDLNWAFIEGNSLDPNLPNAGMGFDPDFLNGTGGNNLTMQLIMDGLKLQPANPSFLDARDAIMAADVALTGGVNQATLWTVFARRGMGFSADDGGSSNTLNVTEAFDLPPASMGMVDFDEDVYEVGEDVTIQVSDFDLLGGGPFDVVVTSSAGDMESVTLNAIGGGLFEGSISTVAGAPAADGVLNLASGQTITVTYNDADDGTGNPAVVTDTASVIQFITHFFQDFENGLGANESTFGNFSINNTNGTLNNGTLMMGHPGTYGNNEYSYYDLSVDLTGLTDAQLQFEYTAQIEDFFDGFNVQASSSPLNPPNDLLLPVSGMIYDAASGSLPPNIGGQTYDSGGSLESNTAVFDLTGFLGGVVNLRFQFGSDSSVLNPGINIDNLAIRSLASRTGAVSFDADTYEVGDTVGIQLSDIDLAGAGSIGVTVSTTDGDIEVVTLTEIGSGNFTGSINTVAGSPAADGQLNIGPGPTVITVAYNDADDGSGNPAVATDSANINQFNALFFQDFENGLGTGETVVGNFSINNTHPVLNNGSMVMGHPDTYDRNEYSYYQFSVDLSGVTEAELRFDYSAQIEDGWDGFNVQVSNSALNPPNDLLQPVSGMFYDGVNLARPNLGNLTYDSNGNLETNRAVFDLTPFVGAVANVRLQFASDSITQLPGINFDNVSVLTPIVPATFIIDNGDAGFSTINGNRPDVNDDWMTASGEGRDNDIHFTGLGDGSAIARWEFNGLAVGNYRVSATWSDHPNRASNAPFTILDSVGGNMLETQSLNQQVAPNDFSADGTAWENIGVVTVTGETMVVELGNGANGFVIADAIRLEQTGSAPTNTVRIIDDQPNGSASFNATAGFSQSPIGEGRDNDVRFASANSQPQTATWTFTNLTPGNYDVAATWSAHANRATNAPFTIRDGSGGAALNLVRVNQEQTPDDFSDRGSNWEQLTTVTITGFELVVELGNNANQFVIADAIRVERSLTQPLPPGTIIDDGDVGYTAIGGWNVTPITEGHLGDIQYRNAGDGSSRATWQFDGLTTGATYRVSATWSHHANRATDAPFTILDDAGAFGTVDINQEVAPDDFVTFGSAFEDLGTFTLREGTSLMVVLTNNANGYVIADAIRVQEVSAAPFSGDSSALSLPLSADLSSQSKPTTSWYAREESRRDGLRF